MIVEIDLSGTVTKDAQGDRSYLDHPDYRNWNRIQYFDEPFLVHHNDEGIVDRASDNELNGMNMRTLGHTPHTRIEPVPAQPTMPEGWRSVHEASPYANPPNDPQSNLVTLDRIAWQQKTDKLTPSEKEQAWLARQLIDEAKQMHHISDIDAHQLNTQYELGGDLEGLRSSIAQRAKQYGTMDGQRHALVSNGARSFGTVLDRDGTVVHGPLELHGVHVNDLRDAGADVAERPYISAYQPDSAPPHLIGVPSPYMRPMRGRLANHMYMKEQREEVPSYEVPQRLSTAMNSELRYNKESRIRPDPAQVALFASQVADEHRQGLYGSGYRWGLNASALGGDHPHAIDELRDKGTAEAQETGTATRELTNRMNIVPEHERPGAVIDELYEHGAGDRSPVESHPMFRPMYNIHVHDGFYKDIGVLGNRHGNVSAHAYAHTFGAPAGSDVTMTGRRNDDEYPTVHMFTSHPELGGMHVSVQSGPTHNIMRLHSSSFDNPRTRALVMGHQIESAAHMPIGEYHVPHPDQHYGMADEHLQSLGLTPHSDGGFGTSTAKDHPLRNVRMHTIMSSSSREPRLNG